LNSMAWHLATCPDEKLRDPKRAIELAEKAVAGFPMQQAFQSTLGTARYRAGDWKQAVAGLEQAVRLRKPDDSENAVDGFFLAMSHWRLGEKGKAREWFDKSIAWMEKQKHPTDELRRFHAEAATLLGAKDK